MISSNRPPLFPALIVSLPLLFSAGSPASAADDDMAPAQPGPEQVGADRENLIWGFSNMYQPCVREFPGESYRYKMWFFGWAVGIGNKGYPGCDAIFHARSKDLKNGRCFPAQGAGTSP